MSSLLTSILNTIFNLFEKIVSLLVNLSLGPLELVSPLEASLSSNRPVLALIYSSNKPDLSLFCNQNSTTLWTAHISTLNGAITASKLNPTSLPFVALFINRKLIFKSPFDDSTCELLVGILHQVQPEILQAKYDRDVQENDRMIRKMQDEAFKKSLEIDAEKQKIQDELDKQESIKKDLLEAKIHAKNSRVEQRKQLIESFKLMQVVCTADKTSTRISIRLPNGDRIVKTFDPDGLVENIYIHVMTLDLPIEADYTLVTMMPRRVLDLKLTIRDAGLINGSVLVEDEFWEEI